MEVQPSNPSSRGHQQSELHFILVNGLAKAGIFFGLGWFLINYFSNNKFHFADSGADGVWPLVYESVIRGAFFGLALGLAGWHLRGKKSK